ncbi:MAG: molybdopterin-dependent oxidoreductase, partial [Betaproteobacteria bacterium]|nr:molybdopterin-dependent oxidoreductase [Betaproteobacteria bacterium]
MQTLKGRLEDERMLTGRGRYVSDWELAGQAYGHFLRSDRAHAEIASIDVSAALAQPGVLAVLTGDDVAAAGLKSLPAALGAKGRGGTELVNPGRPALAQGRVRFAGDVVALVVAATAAQAQDAAELIAVEYRDLSAVVSPLEALRPDAPRVHDTLPGNLAFDYESGDEAKTRAAFARAAHVVSLNLDITRMIANPMEPRACLAAYDARDGTYQLHTCTQGAPIMRSQLAAVLGVPAEKIRVIADEVGGGFGVRFNIYPEYCAALLAAKRLGRPVKWVGTRSEV